MDLGFRGASEGREINQEVLQKDMVGDFYRFVCLLGTLLKRYYVFEQPIMWNVITFPK